MAATATEKEMDYQDDYDVRLHAYCAECGSENLTFKVYGQWNVDRQQFEAETSEDRPVCNECDYEGWANFEPKHA